MSGPGHQSSARERVAVQRVEGTAALLCSGDFGNRSRRAKHVAQGRTAASACFHLLGHVANLLEHGLGVLVACLQLVRDLRGDSALGRVGFDKFHHLEFGLAVIADELAGLLRRRMPIAGGLDELAALLRLFAKGMEFFMPACEGPAEGPAGDPPNGAAPPSNGEAPAPPTGGATLVGKEDDGGLPTEAVGAAPLTGGKAGSFAGG